MAYTDIDKPSDYFNTKLYTGNGSTQSITGVGFQPDFTWIKSRSSGSWHHMGDIVRGADKRLQTNSTNAESTATTGITSWDSDGFSLGSNGDTNASSATFASWNWLADNTSGSSNTDGSITSTVSANTTSGFSIVSYTGTGSTATIGHSLNSAPAMIITKDRGNAEHWACYNKNLPAGYNLYLNLTNAQDDNDTVYTTTAPTSSVYSVGTNNRTNGSGRNYIAYCFSEVKAFSKIGQYTGNGSSSGPFIFTGFKPSFVLQKSTAVQGWQLQDNKRNGFNGANKLLQPHDSASESDVNRIDILSNGFRVITTDAGQNTSGQKYIYMAFAESPFVTSTGIPTTAR